MFCNNVSVICYMLVTGYVLLGLLRNSIVLLDESVFFAMFSQSSVTVTMIIITSAHAQVLSFLFTFSAVYYSILYF